MDLIRSARDCVRALRYRSTRLAKLSSKTGAPKVALVGGETLLGRELHEVIESRVTGALITTYASSGEGNFGEEDGEAIYIEPLEAQSLASEHAVLLAGLSDGAVKAYELVKAAGGRPSPDRLRWTSWIMSRKPALLHRY